MSIVREFKSLGSKLRLLLPRPVSISAVITPLDEALIELERRRTDPELLRKVEEYLENDIPTHFRGDPILYLARHVATPNFETLRFLSLVEPLPLSTVIGQDLKDKFVPKNPLKKAMAKMPIITGPSVRKGVCHETYERISVIDFNKTSGKPFSSIETLWGESFADFHKNLFASITKLPVNIVNESDWIDRQHRGNLLAHYKKFLALFVVHGILFEDYAFDDREEAKFIKRVLWPACRFIEEHFGVRPLIAELTPRGVESPGFWISYPEKVLSIVHRKLGYTNRA